MNFIGSALGLEMNKQELMWKLDLDRRFERIFGNFPKVKKHPKNVRILFLLSLSHVCHRVITTVQASPRIDFEKKQPFWFFSSQLVTDEGLHRLCVSFKKRETFDQSEWPGVNVLKHSTIVDFTILHLCISSVDI